MNILHVIGLYIRIQENPYKEVVPRTFIFAGKAAPGYYMAKLIIRFINAVASVVNNDPKVNGRLKIVFYLITEYHWQKIFFQRVIFLNKFLPQERKQVEQGT